jgi:uncharacterized protein YciI
MRIAFGLVLSCLLLFGCASAPSAAVADDRADYVFVFIRTGPAKGLEREQLNEAFAGHFANMARLAAQGDLLVAGPLGDPRVEPDHRGVFIFDREDVAAGLELAATDPCGKLGIFVFEGHRWRGPTALRRVGELDAALRAELPADAGPGATARSYVLVRAADADRAAAALARLPDPDRVPVYGEFVGEGPREALFVLDAPDLDTARQILAQAGEPDDFWVLHPWFASRALTML